MSIFKGMKELAEIKSKQMMGDVEPGSSEAWAWIENWHYQFSSYPFTVQAIYDRMVYKRLTASCNDEQLYELMNLIERRGLSAGMVKFINELKRKMKYEMQRKEWMINNQLKNEQVEMEELERALEEEKNESSLTREQRVQRHTMGIPNLKEILDLPVIEQKENEDGVAYAVFDKLYGRYHAIIVSPSRRTSDGKMGCVHIMDPNLHGIGGIIDQARTAYRHEQARQAGYYTRQLENERKNQQQIQNNMRNSIKNNIDISHVERAMGLDLNNFPNDDLSGDIF